MLLMYVQPGTPTARNLVRDGFENTMRRMRELVGEGEGGKMRRTVMIVGLGIESTTVLKVSASSKGYFGKVEAREAEVV